MPLLAMVTIDTTDPRRIAGWWAERLGGQIVFDAEGWFSVVSVPGWTTNLGFQHVEDPTPGKNRVHLDIDLEPDADRDAVIAAWTEAGARHVDRVSEGEFGWDVFADPDDNLFCIADLHQ